MRTNCYAKHSEISPLQVYFLIFLTQFGTGVLSLPREVTKLAGQDGWISVLLATLLSMAGSWIGVKLALNFKGKTIIEINRELLGNLLGTIASLGYFAYFFALAVYQLRNMTDLVAIWVLPRFPFQSALLLATIPLVYLTRNGIKVMGRLFNLYYYHLLPLSIIILWPAWNFEPRFIFPVLGEGILPVLKGLAPIISAFLGFETILFLNPFLQKPEKTMFPVQAATLTAGFLYTITVFVLTGYFGVHELQFQLWPTIYVARTVTIAFLERLDIFIDITWIIVSFTTLSMYYYMASFSLARILNQKEHKNFTLILLIPLIIGAFVPKNLYQVMVYGQYITKFGLILAAPWPLLVLILFYFKKSRGEKRES